MDRITGVAIGDSDFNHFSQINLRSKWSLIAGRTMINTHDYILVTKPAYIISDTHFILLNLGWHENNIGDNNQQKTSFRTQSQQLS